MIRRLALISSVAILSAVAFAPKAQAQTQDINFNGNIGSFCTFSAVGDGVLVKGNNVGGQWVEGTTGIPNLGNGTPGSATINCSSGGTLTVGLPVKVTAPSAFLDIAKQAVVYATNLNTETTTGAGGIGSGGLFDNGAWQKPTAPLVIPAATDINLKVGMAAGELINGAGVPSGIYQYRVTLTATPN